MAGRSWPGGVSVAPRLKELFKQMGQREPEPGLKTLARQYEKWMDRLALAD
jgi:hypothetical protein